MNGEGTRDIATAGLSAGLWLGILGAGVVWALHLTVGYAIAPLTNHSSFRAALIIFGAACSLITLLAGVASLRDWRAAGGGSPDSIDGGKVARSRFLGALGVAAGALFTLAILAQSLGTFFFSGDWK